ncbi:MAG: phage antirepressor N-terminal domain-containing protein [Chloroflexaceae bacterium]
MSDLLPQHKIPFYEDELMAVQQPDGVIFAILPQLCDNLGVTREGQTRRIQRHAVLSEGLVTLKVQTEGGTQTVRGLRIDLLPLWLSGIQASRVKEELRHKLVRYQREAAFVLWQAFKSQIVPETTALEASPSPEVEQSMQELQRIAEMGEAIAHMARQQMEIQRQQHHLAERLNKAGQVVKVMQSEVANVKVRLDVLEDKLHPHAYITDQQAANVANAVKALAEMLTRQKGKNQYQGVFAELHRRFGVSSYKHIRQEQYDAVLTFLDDWYAAAKEGREQQEGTADE